MAQRFAVDCIGEIVVRLQSTAIGRVRVAKRGGGGHVVAEPHLDLAEAIRQLNEAFDTSDMTAICLNPRNNAVFQRRRSCEESRSGTDEPLSGIRWRSSISEFSTVLAVLDGMNLQMKIVRRKTSRKASPVGGGDKFILTGDPTTCLRQELSSRHGSFSRRSTGIQQHPRALAPRVD